MPSQTDPAPMAMTKWVGLDVMGLEISGQG